MRKLQKITTMNNMTNVDNRHNLQDAGRVIECNSNQPAHIKLATELILWKSKASGLDIPE
jgi:hypothetical protein